MKITPSTSKQYKLNSIAATLLTIGLSGCDPLPSNLRVLAFGDSGSCDNPSEPQNCKQNEVARNMKQVCDRLGCDMGIMLGDNIYEDGVVSPHDDKFRYKFEYHYAPLDRPLYASVGNHDIWGLNTTEEEQINAQVEYTKYSNTWKMLDEYYDYMHAGVHFFVINSNHFDDEQRLWLEEGLSLSNANWKVVYGHHPIYSNGYHGDNHWLIEYLLPIVCAHADLYVAGHDHDLQLLDADCGIPLVISGAAGKTRSSNTNEDAPRRRWSVSSTYGFSRLNFKENSFTVHYYNDSGIELFTRTYNRMFRLQVRDATKPISDNISLIAKRTLNTSHGNIPRVAVLPTKNGNNLWTHAMWRLERSGDFVGIKNHASGKYLHFDKTTNTITLSRANPFAFEQMSSLFTEWALDASNQNALYIKNRYSNEYLSVDSEGKLVMSESIENTATNWILSPVDFESFD